jgi:hypothetical protein
MTKLKRELLSTAAMQPIQPQRAAPPNKSFRTMKLRPPRDNSRAKRRHASAAKRSCDDAGTNGDGDGDGDGAGRWL